MGTDYYFIVTYLEAYDNDAELNNINQSVRSAFTDFFHFSKIIESDFEYSVVYILGRKKYYESDKLTDLIHSLPWIWPETLQILVKSEHEERYRFFELDRPKRHKVDTKDMVFRDGKWQSKHRYTPLEVLIEDHE